MTSVSEMDDDLVGLPEAAQHLGVHYMTAYRYVRTGRLPAHKHGGEWRIRRGDLASLPVASDAAPSPRPRVNWPRRLASRLLAGDEPGAWQVVEDALTGGADPAGIHLEILCPALRAIGDRWATTEVSVAEEHRATSVALRLVGRMGPLFAKRGRRRGEVLLGAAPGDRHGIPVAIVADLLRTRGYAVTDLGADVPAASFAEMARLPNDLLAVGIAATTSGNEASIRKAASEIKQVTRTPILLGGRAIPDEATARRLGADVWAHDGAGAVAAVDRIHAEGQGR